MTKKSKTVQIGASGISTGENAHASGKGISIGQGAAEAGSVLLGGAAIAIGKGADAHGGDITL